MPALTPPPGPSPWAPAHSVLRLVTRRGSFGRRARRGSGCRAAACGPAWWTAPARGHRTASRTHRGFQRLLLPGNLAPLSAWPWPWFAAEPPGGRGQAKGQQQRPTTRAALLALPPVPRTGTRGAGAGAWAARDSCGRQGGVHVEFSVLTAPTRRVRPSWPLSASSRQPLPGGLTPAPVCTAPLSLFPPLHRG